MTGQDGLYASAVYEHSSKEIILKLVNTSDKAVNQKIVIECKAKLNPKAMLTVLKSDNQDVYNTLEKPLLIAPSEMEISLKGKTAEVILAPYSFIVIKLKQAR